MNKIYTYRTPGTRTLKVVCFSGKKDSSRIFRVAVDRKYRAGRRSEVQITSAVSHLGTKSRVL